jgi:hypothetical protein
MEVATAAPTQAEGLRLEFLHFVGRDITSG